MNLKDKLHRWDEENVCFLSLSKQNKKEIKRNIMKFSFLVFILFFSPVLWSKGILELPSAFNLEVARQRCSSSPTRDEAILITANLRFRQSPEKMIENAKRLYGASERLANRAYFSSKQQKFIAPYLGQNTFVTVPSRLLESVTRHIETALRLGYVDHIIFSDMGHAHLLAPVDIYEKLRHNLSIRCWNISITTLGVNLFITLPSNWISLTKKSVCLTQIFIFRCVFIPVVCWRAIKEPGTLPYTDSKTLLQYGLFLAGTSLYGWV